MVSFSKTPGTVALCVVVLTRTLASAAPAPRRRAFSHTTGFNPLLAGIIGPITSGAGKALSSAASGTYETADLLGDSLGTLLNTLGDVAANVESGVGIAVGNVTPALEDTMYV